MVGINESEGILKTVILERHIMNAWVIAISISVISTFAKVHQNLHNESNSTSCNYLYSFCASSNLNKLNFWAPSQTTPSWLLQCLTKQLPPFQNCAYPWSRVSCPT
uniref:Uncharacterized protein n=1 Tax=Opuntia streptacantha TaxID=393608 RepID=A0A7C9AAY7_OPUST